MDPNRNLALGTTLRTTVTLHGIGNSTEERHVLFNREGIVCLKLFRVLRKLPAASPIKPMKIGNAGGVVSKNTARVSNTNRSLSARAPPHRRDYTTCPILNMGKYIAITKPPIMMPSMAMIIGSKRVLKESTALSTSSS